MTMRRLEIAWIIKCTYLSELLFLLCEFVFNISIKFDN